MDHGKWRKGVVVGISSESYFVASSNDELFLRKSMTGCQLEIGDCMNFIATPIPTSNKRHHRDMIVQFEKCEQFVEWEMQNHKNAALILSNIVKVTMENHPYSHKLVRCLRTEFLEKVYDNDFNPRTEGFSDWELLNMKAAAVRITNDNNNYFWALLGCNMREKREVVSKNSSLVTNSVNSRIKLKGIVLSLPSKDYYETIYVWVPKRKRHIAFTAEARGCKLPNMFYGNWISFFVNNRYEIDEKSEIELIDHFLPTRIHSYRCEVKVLVKFNKDSCKNEVLLESEECGQIVDTTYTLENYNRLSNFVDSAWVYTFPYDTRRNIRFVLSEKQEEWEDSYSDSWQNSSQYSEDRTKQPDIGKNDFNSYDASNYDHRNHEELSRKREKSRSPLRSSDHHNAVQDSRVRENDSWEQDNRSMKESEKSNTYIDHPESSRRENPTRKKFEEVSDEIWRRERSMPPAREKRIEETEKFLDTEDCRRRSRNGFEERERSKPHERESSDEDSWEQQDRHGFLNKDLSKLSSRQDNVSGPSSSRSVDESKNTQSTLKKLKKRYEYLSENDMDIPEKLKEDIANAILEEQRCAKKKTIDYNDFDDNSSGISDIRKRRELAKIEVNEEELRKYKELVILFREMLASPRVCEEMRRYDEKAMKDINRLIFDL